ncbi:MAG: endonuclease III [Gemmatimonadota bacterium]
MKKKSDAGKPAVKAKTASRPKALKKKRGPGSARSLRRKPGAPPLEVLRRLKLEYPEAHCALVHQSPYQLLVATILSAQCTDARVNMVTPGLFARYPSVHELAQANPAELEEIIKSTGFFRNKTRSLIGMAQAVVADHAGELPRTMEALRRLPGVGRKTANVLLGNAFGINEGITVDTHVTRLSILLGLTVHTDAEKIEQDLMAELPREDWTLVSHLLIEHGRQVCIARRPQHHKCVLADICPSVNL